MRPVDDRQTARIVHHLAAHLDAIAGAHGAARRDADVVDDLEPSRRCSATSKASCIACVRDP